MTRSMSKAKQAEVPAIYPLKGEHKKPEHVKPDEVRNETGEQNLPVQTVQIEPMEIPVVEEYAQVPKVCEQGKEHIYQKPNLDEQVRRPNPLLEPSSYPHVMAKQLPKYEGLIKPQPIEIELRGMKGTVLYH